jgi:archaellum biogenesis protein FlaJ (TadC family)
MSLAFFPKRTGKDSSDGAKSENEDISDFDLFYQLTYLSATAAAGISRYRLFQLACTLPSDSAKYFGDIYDLVANLRYDFPDACRMVGMRVKSENLRAFLLRLSDALRSGEPIPGFMAREA